MKQCYTKITVHLSDDIQFLYTFYSKFTIYDTNTCHLRQNLTCLSSAIITMLVYCLEMAKHVCIFLHCLLAPQF